MTKRAADGAINNHHCLSVGFVGIDGGCEHYLPFHQPHFGDFMPDANHQQIWLIASQISNKKCLFKHHTRLPTSNERNDVLTPQRQRLIDPPTGKHYGSVLEMAHSVRKTTVMGVTCLSTGQVGGGSVD